MSAPASRCSLHSRAYSADTRRNSLATARRGAVVVAAEVIQIKRRCAHRVLVQVDAEQPAVDARTIDIVALHMQPGGQVHQRGRLHAPDGVIGQCDAACRHSSNIDCGGGGGATI